MAEDELTVRSAEFPNGATPLGSDLYYAIRFAPPALRNDLALLAALRQRIFRIPGECSEPAVALKKAHWWREELNRVADARPSHPLTRQLATLMTRYPLPVSPLLQIVDAIILEIEHAPFENAETLAGYCWNDMGVLCELFVRLHPGTPDACLIEDAHRLGVFIGMSKIIQDTGALLRSGRHLIPRNLLKHGVQNGAPMETAEANMVAAAAAQLADWNESKYPQISKSPDRRLLPALVLAKIAKATLREIRKDGVQVTKERLSLTPLHKLWLSWWLARGMG